MIRIKDSGGGVIDHIVITYSTTHRRMRRGGRGGSCPPKFGQTVGEIRAKQEEKSSQRKLQINPFGMWMMTSHRQCPRGGGCLWMSKSRGVFQISGGWMTSRGQCPRGGCLWLSVYNFGQINPSAPPNQSVPIRLWYHLWLGLPLGPPLSIWDHLRILICWGRTYPEAPAVDDAGVWRYHYGGCAWQPHGQ